MRWTTAAIVHAQNSLGLTANGERNGNASARISADLGILTSAQEMPAKFLSGNRKRQEGEAGAKRLIAAAFSAAIIRICRLLADGWQRAKAHPPGSLAAEIPGKNL